MHGTCIHTQEIRLCQKVRPKIRHLHFTHILHKIPTIFTFIQLSTYSPPPPPHSPPFFRQWRPPQPSLPPTFLDPNSETQSPVSDASKPVLAASEASASATRSHHHLHHQSKSKKSSTTVNDPYGFRVPSRQSGLTGRFPGPGFDSFGLGKPLVLAV